ncbi:complement factor H-like [Zootoca vivipara]|uniref:complement factor H-like n=1 Tax=Zootoca vivipara TaxID=8524 RepID=UPI00293BE992|nr:complement factor H-like [Zootoca vivipara]
MKSWLVSVLPFLLWTCCTSQNVCEEPPDIDFGEMISDEKARYLEGDRTQYKCNLGYVLEGTEWIKCHGQKWTPAPRCLAPCGITKQQLDAKDLLLPGKRRRSQVIQHNHTLQFLCKEGHVITAPSVRKCINGHMDLPSCISEMGKNCSHTPTIENGDIITLSQKQYASGSSVEFKCQKYYAMEGENRTFCNNGNWTKVPICLEPCAISLGEMESKKVELVGQSDKHHFQNFYVQRGTSVELACKPGHAPAANYSPSAFVIRCNGEAIVYPECEEIACNPPKVANGTFRPQRNIYHGEDLIQIQCDSGFHLADGHNFAECTRNGWSPLPQCSAVKRRCGPPPPVENAVFLGTTQMEYMPGAKVRYKCQALYNMQGNQDVQCVNGHWTDTPTCKDATCGEPPAVAGAEIVEGTAEAYLPDHKVQYQCHEGFEISGSASVTCQNKEWSEPLTCVDVTCPPPPRISNGQVMTDLKQRYLPLEKVRYRCHQGYSLFGAFTVKCVNKEWTESPRCIDAAGKCGPPPPIENGDFLGMATSEYMPGAIVQYKCQALYNMQGNQDVRCVNGHWTDTPTCIGPCTGDEEVMNRNNIRLKWKYETKFYLKSGEVIEFDCKREFLPDPSSPPFRALCREGKLDYPRCIPENGRMLILMVNIIAVCEEPPDIDFGEMISDEKARYLEGDRTQYKCGPGYVLEGTEWIICRGQKWTPAPRCMAPCGITKQQLDAKDLLLPGKRRRSQVIQHNHTLQFLCKEGHVITVPSVRKCIDGHMDLPSCISEMGKNCSHTPTIENGDIITLSQKQYASGSSVEFKCQKYYAMEGENRTFCNNGNWTKVPICLEPCAISLAEIESKKVEVVGQADKHHFQNFYVQRGTSVELACKPGHVPAANYSPSTFIIRCNGEAIVYPECNEIACNPPKVANGTFRPRRNIYHGEDLIQIQCDSGFYLADGQNVAECTRNGWSPLPQCRQIGTCQEENIDHGYILNPKKLYKEGDQVHFLCTNGYKHAERSDATCTQNGWSSRLACIEIVCSPPHVENGNFQPEQIQYEFEDTIETRCEPGYQIRQATSMCTETGWSPPPTCIPKNCDYIRIENGQLSDYYERWRDHYFPRRVGQTVDYRCHDGFLSRDKETWHRVSCTKFGWSPEPKCFKKCDIPRLLEHGTFNAHTWQKFIEGDETLYSCEDGYVPANQQTKTVCTKNGWSPAPRCNIRKTCGPKEPPNGFFTERRNRYNLNDKISYRCQPGFTTPQGLETGDIQCHEEGWKPEPKCIKTCQVPTQNNEIFNTSQSVFVFEEILHYKCKDGFETIQKATGDHVVCTENGWSSKPECLPIHCDGFLLENGLLDPRKNQYQHRDVVKFSCRGSYTRVGPDSAQCYHFGWSPQPPTCKVSAEVNPCQPPPDISDGTISGDLREEYNHGEKVEYKCNFGFAVTGSKLIECLDGQWTSLPLCKEEPRTCEAPPSIRNGGPVSVDSDRYLHGKTVAYECNESFSIVGTKEAVCLHGQWELPLCVDVAAECTRPQNAEFVPYASLMKKFNHNTIVTYTCGSNQHKTKCVNGKWSPEPECTAFCPPPPQLPNAIDITDTRNYKSGEEISFRCQENFLLQGPPKIKCDNGKWQTPPRCFDTRCGDPPAIAHGEVNNIYQRKYLSGESVEYHCHEGFELGESSTSTCENREWSPPPTCRVPCNRFLFLFQCITTDAAGNCAPPPPIENGDFLGTATAEYRQGAIVQYKCQALYIMQGNQYVQCVNGHWIDPPTCIVPCTATEEDMNQNNIQLKWKYDKKIYTASGDVTEFACKWGFWPDPSSPPFRAPCREGKLDYPRCIRVGPSEIT